MPQNSKNKALIIGVGQRPRSRDASDMNICIRDAEAMARALKICSSVHHPICLTGPDTTCANIKTQLERLNDSGDVADLTVVYFSGHGIHKNGQYFLVGYDSSDESSALDGSIFLALLSNIKTQKLLVLLDCCHSGGFAQSAHIPFEYQHFLQEKNTNRVILTASDADQKSLLATPNSNFTYAILEALEGQRQVERMLAAGRWQFAWEIVNTQPAQRPVGRAQIVAVHSDEEWGCDPVVPPLIWPLPLDLDRHWPN